MAKKTSKTAKSNELDGKEFFAAIALIEKEKGIPKSYMLEKITQALVSAYKRDHEGITDNVFVEANEITETCLLYTSGIGRHHVDQVLYTGVGAGAAAVALFLVHLDIAIHNRQGPKGTGGHTGTGAYASIDALMLGKEMCIRDSHNGVDAEHLQGPVPCKAHIAKPSGDMDK